VTRYRGNPNVKEFKCTDHFRVTAFDVPLAIVIPDVNLIRAIDGQRALSGFCQPVFNGQGCPRPFVKHGCPVEIPIKQLRGQIARCFGKNGTPQNGEPTSR